jgi:hypothetical protein
MLNLLKGSLIVNLIIRLFSGIATSYKNSRFKRFVGGCGVCFKSSVFYRTIRAYFYHPAYFEYSLTHRFILWLVKVFDVPIGLIGRFVRYLVSGSAFVGTADELATSNARQRLLTGGVIILFLAVGYSVGLLIKGASLASFTAPLVLAVIAVILAIVAYSLSTVKVLVTNSLIYRLIKYFI